MKKLSRLIVTILLLFFIGCIIYLNSALYYKPDFTHREESRINVDLLHHMQYLKGVMHNGAANDMQNLYPEGFVFMHSLYGLSWADLIKDFEKNDTLRKEALAEIEYSIKEINSPKGKAVFPKDLQLSHGAFYNGWLNYLTGKYLQLQNENERNEQIVADFKARCRLITAALDSSESPFLESYTGMAWPADMMGCLASLSLHDRIFEPEYEQIIDTWLVKAEQHTDTLGLIPHSSDASSGDVIESSRGSSQSLILNFLIEIDSSYARKKFSIFKEHFVDYRFGLPGILEYPKGSEGDGDIDSGPVILGIGGAASIVGQRTMHRYGETTTYIALRNCIETFGAGDDEKDGKKYLFGILPVADAFIAWSNSVETAHPACETESWRSKFQIISFITVACLTIIIAWVWKKSIFKNPKQYNSTS